METKVTGKDYLKVFIAITLIFVVPALLVWQISAAREKKNHNEVRNTLTDSFEEIQDQFAFLNEADWDEMLSRGGGEYQNSPLNESIKKPFRDACNSTIAIVDGFSEFFNNHCVVRYLQDGQSIEIRDYAYHVSNEVEYIEGKFEDLNGENLLVEGDHGSYRAYFLLDNTDNVLIEVFLYIND